jgi:hypothetical protein
MALFSILRAHKYAAVSAVVSLSSLACGGNGATESQPTPTAQPTPPSAPPATTPPANPSPAASAQALPQGLLVACSQFAVEDGRATARPGPARLDLVTFSDGAWHGEVLEDPYSNVFHKAMVFTPPGAAPGILTIGGVKAAAKLWRHGASGWTSELLYEEDFGGRTSRLRDAEIGNLYGDGPSIAIATHDQGVVAVIKPNREVVRLDRRPNTFVHEVEIGDLDGDHVLEVYATPSDPNSFDGREQHGEVVRYVPSRGGERTVVANLGNRHAKEIWVGDADGDGRDELYVAVEALTRGTEPNVEIVEPVEIRRYDAGTPADARVVVATVRDRLTRFLTVGDIDGDGKKEMVIAAYSSGLWLARPGRDPRGEWSVESLDRQSGGFEHSALIADLDENGTGELYVAADAQGELRRYVWANGRAQRETLLRREVTGSIMTWNLMPFPVSLSR